MNKNIEVINYRPDLNYDKTPSLDILTNKENLGYTQNPISVCLNEFSQNLPSDTINSIDKLTERISNSLSELEEKMSKLKIGQSFIDANESDRNIIISNNYNDPYGSTYIEAYVELENIKDELENLKSDYTVFTYGDDINYEEANLIDNNLVDKLISLENENEIKDIGYTSIYFETMISNMINSYVYKLDDEAIVYLTDLNEECKDMPFDDKYVQLLLNNFQKKQETLKNDVSKDTKTSYNIKVALKNAFLALQEYEDSLSAVDSLDSDIENRDLGLEIKVDTFNNLSKSLLELMHILYYSPIAKTDISNSIKNKSNIREYFIE